MLLLIAFIFCGLLPTIHGNCRGCLEDCVRGDKTADECGVICNDPNGDDECVLRGVFGHAAVPTCFADATICYWHKDWNGVGTALCSGKHVGQSHVQPNYCAPGTYYNVIEKARCADILWQGSVWGLTASGVKLGPWTHDLQFIGCVNNGCPTSSFYCHDDATSITFGTTSSGAMRSQVGDYIPSSFVGCCGPDDPQGLCNSPDDQASVDELCGSLGYNSGEFELVASNYCPEPHFNPSTGWTNEFNGDYGYGKSYRCFDKPAAKCADIAWQGTVWGLSANGVKLDSYTPGLQFIGCVNNGCPTSSFYCHDDEMSITFGTTSSSGAMRSQVGEYIPSSFAGCCGPDDPEGLCNSPDDQVSVDEICQSLGYDAGQFEMVVSNYCPEPHFDGGQWTNHFNGDWGYGKSYTCFKHPAAKVESFSNLLGGIPEKLYPEGHYAEGYEPTDGKYYYFQVSQSTIVFIGGLIALILIVNIILICRANCYGKGRAYHRVKNVHSEFADSA